MTVLRNPPRRGFCASEFALRVQRMQSILQAEKLDAVFVTSPSNIRYFTGFDSQFWESPTRPWFVVVPREGSIIAVIPEIGAPEMARTWVEDIRTWPAPCPEDDGVSLMAATLSAVPRRFGRIGAEMGREMALRMPVSDFLALGRRMPGMEIVDGTPALWQARMIKTEAEIAHIRFICEVASDAYIGLPDLISVGDTERTAVKRLRADMCARGADSVPFMPAISGPGGVAQIVCGPQDRVLANGDVLFIDTGATYDGYFCDFDRVYAVGSIDDAARRANEAVWHATELGIRAARPGRTMESVWKVMAEALQDAGSIGNNVGRLGHGLGMQLTEPPSFREGEETVIQPGMVLTIEPGMEYAPGKMIVHEEDVVIMDDGAHLLTIRAPKEMPVIS
ncbi:Xaa-Pro peptidase family protein [Komagataeibacter sp. FNDCF1]|uniref:M24 family metallopeptidase n=1 Tax=Komagataeibacter sp. FNDCF1 TaxID=2878681 RepID=UPI001E394B4F|nr:Xaa-Pro peptidase family protein [Komagataeibacter sp. FNDCF1]MCE2563308.1 Xaa-Pro peptidase family protein [Komagataeibacter sp. FNDCF1]